MSSSIDILETLSLFQSHSAAEFGILGKYLVSAEDNVIIADNPALHYYIQKGHMIMVVESLENHDVRYIKLEEIGESETDDDLPGSQGAKEEQFLRLKHISSQLGHVEGSLNDFINNFGSTGDNNKSFQSSN